MNEQLKLLSEELLEFADNAKKSMHDFIESVDTAANNISDIFYVKNKSQFEPHELEGFKNLNRGMAKLCFYKEVLSSLAKDFEDYLNLTGFTEVRNKYQTVAKSLLEDRKNQSEKNQGMN